MDGQTNKHLVNKNGEFEETQTFTGITSSKSQLIRVLDSALHFKIKWTFYVKKKWFYRKEYHVILSGAHVETLNHFFNTFALSTPVDFLKIREWYETYEK